MVLPILYEHSSKREVRAGTRKALARMVDPDVLLAVKLHSERENLDETR